MDKRYRIFNWTVFGFVCYMAALPVFARAMRFLLPQIWRCSYLRMTGQPCPFCGTTGDLARLWHGNFDFRNPVTPLLAMFLLFELVWRSVLLLRRRLPARLMWWDLGAHILLLSLLLGAYLCVWFAARPCFQTVWGYILQRCFSFSSRSHLSMSDKARRQAIQNVTGVGRRVRHRPDRIGKRAGAFRGRCVQPPLDEGIPAAPGLREAA